jgi:hypothetical protein
VGGQGRDDGDMTGQDPTSSAAEGDAEPGSEALAEAGTGHGDGGDGGDTGHRGYFAAQGPPAEAADDEPVTDAPPVED